jgi:superfamily II DNA or RNA helicase
MSPLEDLLGRVSKACPFELRNGQLEAVTYVADNQSEDIFNFVLPTGYGKSVTGLATFDVLKGQGRVNRLLIVVPTGTQKDQYADDIASTSAVYCLQIRLPESHEDRAKIALDGATVGLRLHRENQSQVFIATIQHIQRNPDFYADLMSTGRWAVFADEYHKLNAEAEWGKAASNLNYTVIFGMTATPVRTDGKPTIFMGKPEDVLVSFEDAYKEEAIRGVVAHIEHYFVDVEEESDDGEKVVRRKTTEDLGSTSESRELRYLSKYYASILSSAHDCLQSLELQQKGQHQMLVFAVDVQHAKTVSNLLNDLFGPDFSDWVGTGASGRSDAENKAVLRRYKNGTDLKCLVQCNMATEGFDNPTSSVLVFINNPARVDTVTNQQAGGRGVRRNYGIKNFLSDVCHMFASPDNPMADVIKQLADRTLGPIEVGPTEPGGNNPRGNVAIYPIPPMIPSVVDAEFDRSEIIKNLKEEEVKANVAACLASPGAAESGVNIENAEEFIRNFMVNQEIERRKAACAKADAEANSLENWHDRVKKATRIVVGNITRLRYGSSAPKTAIGDVAKQLNQDWVRFSGRRHEAMTSADFKRKYQWLESINQQIGSTRKVPEWVAL